MPVFKGQIGAKELRQVATYWNWAEVHEADNYLRELESLRDRNVSSEEYVPTTLLYALLVSDFVQTCHVSQT